MTNVFNEKKPISNNKIELLVGENVLNPIENLLLRLRRKRVEGSRFNGQTAHRAEMISGQLVTSEIIMASESGCPIEYHRIDVDKCDPVFDKECQGNKYIPFRRADYDRRTGHSPNSPREQVILRHRLLFNTETIEQA